jgi:hypothetical protein
MPFKIPEIGDVMVLQKVIKLEKKAVRPTLNTFCVKLISAIVLIGIPNIAL